MIKMRFMNRKARNLDSLRENQDGGFQIATNLSTTYSHGTPFGRSNQGRVGASYVCRNSSFNSAEGALLAKRVNVPFALMSCAARMKAPQAASARPEPTEMRRTPRSASPDNVS